MELQALFFTGVQSLQIRLLSKMISQSLVVSLPIALAKVIQARISKRLRVALCESLTTTYYLRQQYTDPLSKAIPHLIFVHFLTRSD